jgi:GNAT superfamily N-acetyltransferase
MQLHETTTPSQADMQTVRDGLIRYNLAQVPALLTLPHDDFCVVLRDASGAIIGGAIGEFDWGWLFVDTLWVADSERGKGHAGRIMAALESYAVRQGVTRAYLFTTDFQAKPFYEKIGYRVFGEKADNPRGYRTHYLCKESLVESETDLEVQSPPNPADFHSLNQALIDDIARHVPLEYEPYAIFIRDAGGLVHGGLWGGFYWDWYDLRFLWIDDMLRGQGFGAKLIQMLFAACQERRVVGISSDTADFQSLPFYQAQGFEVFATLENRPPGHTSYFIRHLF